MCTGRSTVVVGGGELWVEGSGEWRDVMVRGEWGGGGARLQRRVSATGDTGRFMVVLSMGSGEGCGGRICGGEVERGHRLRVGSARG